MTSPVRNEPSTPTEPFVFHLASDDLRRALVRQLSGSAADALVWVDGDSEVVLYPDKTQLILRPGWLLIQLQFASDQTGNAPLTIPLAIGDSPATASVAAVTEETARGDALLAARWGSIAQEIVWDAVLRAGQTVLDARAKSPLVLAGVYTDGERLSFLAVPPVSGEAIAGYYRELGRQPDLPDFKPQPVDLFPDGPPPHIERLMLVDAATGKPINGYADLRDGMTLDLNALPERMSIEATTRPDVVGSVVFDISSDDGYRVENKPPYLMMGNTEDEIFAWAPSPGEYVIQVTPYPEADAGGPAGERLTVRLRVIRKQKLTVTDFVLIDAESRQPIPGYDPIPQKAVINLAELPTRNLNIIARTQPEKVGSVVFGLDDNPQHQVDSDAPYTLFKEEGAWTPQVRGYRVSATPTSGRDGTGTVGEMARLFFTVIDQPKLAVVSFSLIDADKDHPLEQFDPMPDGTTIDLSLLPTRNLNLRANTYPEKVGSVAIDLNGDRFRVEHDPPYAVFGDKAGDYLPFVFENDRYHITATPYPDDDAQGEAGTPLTVRFTVIDSTPVKMAVVSFTLLDARSGDALPGYDPIPDGAKIPWRSLQKHRLLTLRANVNTDEVGSVVFDLGRHKRVRVENQPPFTLFGENKEGRLFGRPFPPGIYRIQATPYSADNGRGSEGVTAQVEFAITR